MSEGPATPGELAERTGLTAGGAITTAIDRLERAGFVTRDRDPNDRRRVIVTAVPEAIFARFGEVYGRVGTRWNAYLETLSDEQLAFANELFARADGSGCSGPASSSGMIQCAHPVGRGIRWVDCNDTTPPDDPASAVSHDRSLLP
jgi:DNA-binding transcriptional ArsR family regulator